MPHPTKNDKANTPQAAMPKRSRPAFMAVTVEIKATIYLSYVEWSGRRGKVLRQLLYFKLCGSIIGYS